ncbi:sulfite exporter TauE/SafE family protein [Pseudomonas sp. N040]|uniref:sulfite exporter TauE/SafE family protein n=1 Tax=Pseudomonas sp. N040 TaxID=2785325 RepID=UPI0018A2C92F|nr:sulfite exporter TauE/SafE family protein [Pseudomonas sp. N040]MBF7731017.1 sulfite exporter TauE/SafE family protein [Pseudomonas sp. N040]MBW7014660.1 sulfite exporter TauE/SafE family protein [Pseudomonas sp. N040]
MLDGSYTLAGALTGFVVGLTGVGGGALMMPILLLLGVNPITAVATDLWFAALTKLVAAGIHSRAEQVDWTVVRRLWLGSLPLALLIVLLVSAGASVQKVDWLGQAIGGVVLLTAAGMLLAPWLRALATRSRIGNPRQFMRWQPAMTVVAGAVLGLCVALTSVGAGALGSVILLYLYPLRMTPHRLVATDIMHAIPLALVAGLGYLFAGRVDGNMLLSLLAGSIPAVIAGSLLSRRLNGRWLQVALALVLLAAGLKTLG